MWKLLVCHAQRPQAQGITQLLTTPGQMGRASVQRRGMPALLIQGRTTGTAPPTPAGCPWPQPLILEGIRLPTRQQDSDIADAGWGRDAAGRRSTVFPPLTLLGARQRLCTRSQALLTAGVGPAHSLGARGAQAHVRLWERGLPPPWDIPPHWGKSTQFSAGGSSTEGTEMSVPRRARLSGHEWQQRTFPSGTAEAARSQAATHLHRGQERGAGSPAPPQVPGCRRGHGGPHL